MHLSMPFGIDFTKNELKQKTTTQQKHENKEQNQHKKKQTKLKLN